MVAEDIKDVLSRTTSPFSFSATEQITQLIIFGEKSLYLYLSLQSYRKYLPFEMNASMETFWTNITIYWYKSNSIGKLNFPLKRNFANFHSWHNLNRKTTFWRMFYPRFINRWRSELATPISFKTSLHELMQLLYFF